MTAQKSRRKEAAQAAAPPPLQMPDRRLMEQHLAAIGRLLEGHEFASAEEANAYLQDMLSKGGLSPAAPTTPLEEAKELIYQALETTGKRRLDLARRALDISPDCADAYVLLAEETEDPHEARRLYEQGVQAGERALGPEVFEQGAGHFWGILETRPYMRARQGLAEVLWHLGERQAAIGHLQDMLRLNPGDNQGVRYTLANWLLAVGDDAALEHLLAQYPDEGSAQWAYTKALHTFRRLGAGKQADQALQEALEVNPHVPAYLLGVKKLPKQLPAYIGMGDENEAVSYVAQAAEPWVETPGALEWLAAVLTRHAAPSPSRRLGRARRQ